jgi:ABC-2 type transport system permease protein
MSTNLASPVLDPTPATLDISGTPKVPFGRLVRLELRKMTDTRAGRWLLGITVGVLVLVSGIIVTVAAFDENLTMSLSDWQGVLTFLTTLLLPTIAIMSVTQEWSQRTGLVTFALEPDRLRIVLAKLVAVLILAVATLLVAAAVGAAAHALMGAINGDVSWSLDGADLGWSLYLQLVYFLMAFGLAMVFLSTPGAIVVYYVVALVLPQIVYGMLYFLLSWGPDVVPWLDLSYAVAAFRNEMPDVPSGTPELGVGPILVSFALWVVTPFAVGLRRILRAELK